LLAEILANTVGGILSQVFGTLLKQPVDRLIDEYNMQHVLTAAVKRAEDRFARDYSVTNPELVHVLIAQTRFADLPSIHSALKDMLLHPFQDTSQTIATLRRSFSDVLPSRVDREQVDAAVNAFLRILGEEVLYIPQLQHLYALAFQKVTAESSRNIAASTAALVECMQDLRDDMKQLPTPLETPALSTIKEPDERSRPWHNLPQRTFTHFVGREVEVQKLTQLLLPYPRSRHFLVTLDGIGGVGKSALALEIAYRYRDTYNKLPPEERFEAIIWVSAKRMLLTARGIQHRQQTFSTLGDLYREIASVLELPLIMQVDYDERRRLVEHALVSKRTLLIVDNLETVDDDEVLTFLRELPDPTKAIVTTRHRIDIAYAIRLTGMPHTDAQALIELEATHKNVDLAAYAVEALYRRTGGVPLAIVWSIALMSLGYPVESVLRRLGSGHSDIARFCFDESMASIHGHDAYRLLIALTMFEASVNRNMLGEVAGLGNDEIGRDDALAELLQLSLVNQEQDCFSLLPLTRSFVLDELERQPELEQMLREQWIIVLTIFAQSYAGPDWHWHDLQQLHQEGTHLGTLAVWAQQTGRIEILLKIIPALAMYYDRTGQWTDLLTIARVSAEYAHLTGDIEKIVYIEIASAWVLSQQGRNEEAEQSIKLALKASEQTGDIGWQCTALQTYSQVLRRRNALDQALKRCQQALQILTHLPDAQRIYAQADIEYELGKIARDRADWHDAQIHFLEAQSVFRHDDDHPAFNLERAWGLVGNLALVAQQLGDLDAAAPMYAQALQFFRDSGGRGFTTTILVRLASLEEQRGNVKIALQYAAEALDWSQRLGLVREQAQAEAICKRLA